MAKKILDEDGVTEIEVYTADEVKARETSAAETAIKAKEAEFGTAKTALEKELGDAKAALATRAGEFKQFRKLSDDALAKLDEAQRTIYNNGLLLEEERKKGADFQKATHDAQVTAVLKAKSGNDPKLFEKLKEVYDVLGIEALTAEQIEKKAGMALGSLRVSEPDLVASVIGVGGGSAMPPGPTHQADKGFGDSDRGKALASELGLTLEPKKK